MSPRRRLLVVVTAALAAVLLVVVGFRLVGGRDPGSRPDQATLGAVLLVPGYGGGVGGLSALADRLRATGRTATVVQLPDGGTGDLAAQAAALDAQVRRALAEGAVSVDVIGYSAGGVVARLWVDEYDGAAVARRIVTLGSPLHGTQLAAAGVALSSDVCPAACRQLAPGSDLLDRLEDSDLPADLPWLSVWTENDETVVPPDSARLDGAVNVSVQRLCPGTRMSHGELVSDPLVVGLVLRATGTAPLAAPADCAALRAG